MNHQRPIGLAGLSGLSGLSGLLGLLGLLISSVRSYTVVRGEELHYLSIYIQTYDNPSNPDNLNNPLITL